MRAAVTTQLVVLCAALLSFAVPKEACTIEMSLVHQPPEPPPPLGNGCSRCYPPLTVAQMPYEAISEERYKSLTAKLRKLEFTRRHTQLLGGGRDRGVRVEEVPDKFCETDACTMDVSGRRFLTKRRKYACSSSKMRSSMCQGERRSLLLYPISAPA